MEHKKIDIHMASLKDASDILRITHDAFKKYARRAGLDTVAALNDTLADVEQDIKNKLVFIAIIEGALVGSVRIELKPGNKAYLSRFGVLSGHQNSGVGKELLHAVDKKMHELGVKVISLHTSARVSSLVRFYYSCGYYIDDIDKTRGYPRGLFIKEISTN